MTDKQIIIDGVDVSGCFYYADGKCLGCYALNEKDCISCYGICKEINDCHYKLYKRKEQECEELKKIINEAKNSKLDLKSFLVGEAVQNEYEQQLDQLKAELEAYKMEAEEGKEINAELKAENEKLKKIIERLDVPKHEVIDMDIAFENEKLKQTLAEIKKIAEAKLNKADRYLILQKISEVEND